MDPNEQAREAAAAAAVAATDAAVMEFAAGLQNIVKMMEPMFETAEGLRADMGRRGYSPTVAEQVAGEFIVQSMRLMYGGAMSQLGGGSK